MDISEVKRLLRSAEKSMVKISSDCDKLRESVDELESLCDSVDDSVEFLEEG